MHIMTHRSTTRHYFLQSHHNYLYSIAGTTACRPLARHATSRASPVLCRQHLLTRGARHGATAHQCHGTDSHPDDVESGRRPRPVVARVHRESDGSDDVEQLERRPAARQPARRDGAVRGDQETGADPADDRDEEVHAGQTTAYARTGKVPMPWIRGGAAWNRKPSGGSWSRRVRCSTTGIPAARSPE